MKLTLRFTLRTQRTTKGAPAFVYLKIRVDGVAAKSAMATGVSCMHKDWCNKTQAIKGRTDLIAEKNRQIEKIKSDVTEIFNTRRTQGKPVSAELLKQHYMGRTAACITSLLKMSSDFLKAHAKQVAALTAEKYASCHNNLADYVRSGLKRQDVDLVEVDTKWARRYYDWHQEARNNGRNTAARNLAWLKKILNHSVEESALANNVLVSLRVKRDAPKPIVFLEEKEMQKLHDCQYFDDRLQKVVDCFLIQCYTGMAYNELLSFDTTQHLQKDATGRRWIVIYRGKTNELCRIPLLKPAQTIIEKYGEKLPVITNQKMNEYLKEVAAVAELEKPETLTTHVGRRTAGTFLLNRGVPLHTVSKILGHSSVKMTERYYAVLLTSTIANDVTAAGLF